MTDPERTPGSHRRTRGANRLAVLVTSLIAIAIVAVAVTITLDKRGEPNRNNASGSSPSGSGPAATANNTPTSRSPSTSPSSSAIVPPATAPPSTAAPPPTAATGTSPSVAATTVAKLPLDVLNDSRITGLAARATAQFQSGGWSVATTGNFKGTDVPETTVFYPDGGKAAADQLAAQFGIQRVLPAPSGLSSSDLTVALARDWADHD